MFRTLCAVLLGAAVSSCTLVDQKTFAPEPDPRPAAPPLPLSGPPAPPAAADPRTPLLTIRYDVPGPDYAKVLKVAIRAARTKRPGGGFDVISVVGSEADAATGRLDAAQIARAVEEERVPRARVHLIQRLDPGVTPREVLVYLR